MRVGDCSRCGKRADYNTPWVDGEGKLLCDRCGKLEDAIPVGATPLQGVEQRLNDAGQYAFVPKWCKGGVIAWGKEEPDTLKCRTTFAWVKGGMIAVPLTEAERLEHPIKVIGTLIAERDFGLHRCTGCGRKIVTEEIAGYPLFAGLNCAECWLKHLQHLEEERQTGRVCRSCNQPYSACCC